MKVSYVSITRPGVPSRLRYGHYTVWALDVDSAGKPIEGTGKLEQVIREEITPGPLDNLTPEQLIVYCGRISSPQNQGNMDTAEKLIGYLIRKRHWSPFSMVDLTVKIETSRAIFIQALRHWTFNVQEFSQRYAEVDLGFEIYPARLQGETNRQGSSDKPVPPEVAGEWARIQADTVADQNARYKRALEIGIAKELARFVLPQSVVSRYYWKGNVRSWIHYLQARLAPDAQLEHKELAEAALVIFKEHFPAVAKAALGC